MRAAYSQDSQKKSIIGAMMSLMQDLQQLAPHPDSPQNKGPLFIKNSPLFKAANDHDTMLGSMMMESLLGTAFSEALSECFGSWTQEFDAAAMMECYSEYITDIEGRSQKTAAHGQGTLARLSGKPISASFNMRGSISAEMSAFLDDMPQRMDIERSLEHYVRQFEMINAQSPAYETPRPRYAA